VQAVHSGRQLFCPVKGCNRAEDASRRRPFHRADNLNVHIRTQHSSTTMIEAGPSLQSTSMPTLWNSESPARPTDLISFPPTQKRRRLSSTDGGEDPQAKRIKELELQLEECRADKEELKVENKLLRQLNENQARTIERLRNKDT